MSEEHIREPIGVHVTMGYKINMGNYESLNIQIGVTDTQQPSETAPEAHERVFNFVNKRLKEKVGAVQRELNQQESQGGY